MTMRKIKHIPEETRYVALLRGINVSGKNKLKMADLRAMMRYNSYSVVRTVLATGNVVFGSSGSDPSALAAAIKATITERFGYDLSVQVRPFAQIAALVAAEPFAGVTVTDDTRLLCSFLSDPPPETLTLPYTAADLPFTVLRVIEGTACSVLTLGKGSGTVDAMAVLEKLFGKQITTRTWNTVQKIAAV